MSNKMSLIIPTRERPVVLYETLCEVLHQTRELSFAVEVVVVKDDNNPQTSAILAELDCESLHVVKAPEKGPATARNIGVQTAHGDVILFLDDDVLPWGDTIGGHYSYHMDNPSPDRAALGFVTWHPRYRLTPFMFWLEHGGPQFCFHEIPTTGVLPYHFYTANISLKRQTLIEAGLFDEHFQEAAFEDLELGFRMIRSGLILEYRPQFGSYHLANVSSPKEYYTQRIQKLGRWLPMFHACVPEAEEYFRKYMLSPDILDELKARPLSETTDMLLEKAHEYEAEKWPPIANTLSDIYQRLYLLHLIYAYQAAGGKS